MKRWLALSTLLCASLNAWGQTPGAYRETVFTSIPIPVATTPFQSGSDAAETLRNIDHYFDEAILVYSLAIQTQLRDIYYNDAHVTVVEGYIETQGAYANWTLNGPRGGPLTPTVLVDARVHRATMFYRLNLIHEVAVHLGQALTRIEQVGIAQFVAENDSGDFRRFTEMSAALVEQVIIRSLNMSQLRTSLQAMGDKAIMHTSLIDYRQRAPYDCWGYAVLEYRAGTAGGEPVAQSVGPEDRALFLERIRTLRPDCLPRH